VELQQRDASDDDDAVQGAKLAAQCELMHAAVTLAWSNVIEAYKLAASDSGNIDPERALVQYRAAQAMQAAAEQALLVFLMEKRPQEK
jgi:phage/plasmid primase-like uncharacterized protein